MKLLKEIQHQLIYNFYGRIHNMILLHQRSVCFQRGEVRSIYRKEVLVYIVNTPMDIGHIGKIFAQIKIRYRCSIFNLTGDSFTLYYGCLGKNLCLYITHKSNTA